MRRGCGRAPSAIPRASRREGISISLSIDAPTEAATRQFGAALAAALPDSAVIELNGPLGAGKTTFVRAVAAACGVPEDEVSSPTFVLLQEYHGDRTIYHFDTYRLKNEAEFIDLGAEEYLAGPGVCIIEWGERVARVLPADRLTVNLTAIGEFGRRFTLIATGSVHAEILKRLSAGAGASG